LIEIGEYSIKAEAQGFKPMEKTGVAVQLQQRARVNFELSIGDTREAIEVVAAPSNLRRRTPPSAR
jgi:hypothetical protein